jgi:hypothetical protein
MSMIVKCNADPDLICPFYIVLVNGFEKKIRSNVDFIAVS